MYPTKVSRTLHGHVTENNNNIESIRFVGAHETKDLNARADWWSDEPNETQKAVADLNLDTKEFSGVCL